MTAGVNGAREAPASQAIHPGYSRRTRRYSGDLPTFVEPPSSRAASGGGELGEVQPTRASQAWAAGWMRSSRGAG